MKQTFNFAVMPGYENEILKTGKNLQEYIDSLSLDGVELLLYGNNIYENDYSGQTVGIHLRYWPNWLPLYENDRETLLRYLKDEDGIKKYFDASSYEEWLKIIHDNIQAALKLKPEYMVWHVADATLEECYTYQFTHSDMEVVEAAAKVFNAAAKDLPEDVWVLFENLWWPGLRLTDKKVVAYFFDLLDHKKSGIMLDTGHLLNTNWNVKDENEGVDYILKVLDDLGEYKSYIKGMHLNCSLSGNYMQSLPHIMPQDPSMIEIMHYICQIDRHKPFTSKRIREVVEVVRPLYLTHELAYNDFIDLEKNLRVQLKACWE